MRYRGNMFLNETVAFHLIPQERSQIRLWRHFPRKVRAEYVLRNLPEVRELAQAD